VGDSRCYRWRNGELQQLTQDHTLVARMVEQGLITPEMARNHPYKNVIRQAVGIPSEEEPLQPQLETFPLQAGDLFLLCSDGLTDMVDDSEIAELLANLPPSRVCWRLMDRALAQGGHDNVTAMLVQVVRLEPVNSAD